MPNIEFCPETRSAILPLKIRIGDQLQQRAEADGFVIKDEFHMTVLPAVSPEEILDKEIEGFRAILDAVPVGDLRLCRQPLFRIIKPKVIGQEVFTRESIIVLARSEKIEELLSRHSLWQYGIKPPRQFPHVTLFTKGDNPYAHRGIGIDSWMDFAGMAPQSYPPQP